MAARPGALFRVLPPGIFPLTLMILRRSLLVLSWALFVQPTVAPAGRRWDFPERYRVRTLPAWKFAMHLRGQQSFTLLPLRATGECSGDAPPAAARSPLKRRRHLIRSPTSIKRGMTGASPCLQQILMSFIGERFNSTRAAVEWQVGPGATSLLDPAVILFIQISTISRLIPLIPTCLMLVTMAASFVRLTGEQAVPR